MTNVLPVLILLIMPSTFALSEQGVFQVEVSKDKNIAVFEKSMYGNTSVSVKIKCGQTDSVDLMITWTLRRSSCAQEFAGVEGPQSGRIVSFFTDPNNTASMLSPVIEYAMGSHQASCSAGQFVYLAPFDGKPIKLVKEKKKSIPDAGSSAETDKNADEKSGKGEEKSEQTASRKKRAADEASTTMMPSSPPPKVVPDKNDKFILVTKTWTDGIYLFAVSINTKITEMPFSATVEAKMENSRIGLLSAIEWPLLPFYGVMCFVYVLYGLIWLVLSACNWRDLLRIQFWIGGVIFLGMLEKAVFFAEYESIRNSGVSVYGALLFGEMISCMKRTLARMLVIIVSLGFGIVKPRLGPVLHKVLGLGALYFILSAVEGCLRHLKSRTSASKQDTFAVIPLAVLDAVICWWIFTGLVSTIRTLRLRRNLVKLSLYRHFTNTLIFAVVASIAFMIWSITQHKFSQCLSDWKELWVDEAFWHLLFSVLLAVIMVLWRPSSNNQRYAFSAIMDAADDEAGEPMMNEAYDGMKMRGVKGQTNGSPGMRDKSKADEDLKWIDENIPSSVADTALPSLLDSDEEMMNTKFEMSKME